MRPNQNHLNHYNELDHINQVQPLQRNYKILVEIVHSTLDVNLSKKIKMSERVNKILDINWSVQPANYQINLSARRLWISSKLCAEITYAKGNSSQVHLYSIYLPWKTTAAFDYITVPVLPQSEQKQQFEFTEQGGLQKNTHYEQTIYNNEIPLLEVISTKVVTSQSISKAEECTYLILDLNCSIEYRILQNQLVQNG